MGQTNEIIKASWYGHFRDSDNLWLGDGEDLGIKWDGTDAHVTVAANNSVINVGDGTLSADVKIFGSSSSNYVVWDASANTLDFTGAGHIDLSSTTSTTHPLNFSSMTLADSCNVIRGTSIVPTRSSGWTCFTGTLSGTSAYMDYREMHTASTELIYGSGFFPFMDSGASVASMSAIQAICQADAGSTLTTAAGAQGTGFYPLWAKALINENTVNSGAQIAAAFLSVQANVTNIAGEASAIMHMEVASGALRDIIYINATGGALATNLLNVSSAVGFAATKGSDYSLSEPRAKFAVKVGASTYYLIGYTTAT